MPPARARAVQEDSQSESSSTKEKQATAGPSVAGKGRRNGTSNVVAGSSLKDVTSAASISAGAGGTTAKGVQNGTSGISWPSEDVPLLNAYRSAYRLDTPAAFKSPLNHIILTNPGIGRLSPTMARKKGKRRISQKELAMAVRRNFNSQAVNETEVHVNFLYKVKWQDKSFRTRFAPLRTR